MLIIACRDDRPVRFQSDRVKSAYRDFSFMQILITDLIAALERITIPCNPLKCLYGSSRIVIRKQLLSFAILRFFSLRCRIAVIVSRLIRRYRAVIVTCRQQAFSLLVLRFFFPFYLLNGTIIRRRAIVVARRNH